MSRFRNLHAGGGDGSTCTSSVLVVFVSLYLACTKPQTDARVKRGSESRFLPIGVCALPMGH